CVTPAEGAHFLMHANRIESLEPRKLLSAGSIDTTFGSKGVIVGHALAAENGLRSPFVIDLAEQSSGKIVAAGAANGGQSLFLTRLNADGDVDRKFGVMGSARLDVQTAVPGAIVVLSDDSTAFVAVDDKDRILLAGTADTKEGVVFLVARFTPD